MFVQCPFAHLYPSEMGPNPYRIHAAGGSDERGHHRNQHQDQHQKKKGWRKKKQPFAGGPQEKKQKTA